MSRLGTLGFWQLLAVLLVLHSSASAQDFQLLRPTGPFTDGLAVESLEMQAPAHVSLSIHADYADGILDTVDPVTLRRIPVIERQSELALGVAWQQTQSLRFQLVLRGRYVSGDQYEQFSGTGFTAADTMLGVRWRLINAQRMGFQLGLLANVVFPTGRTEKLAGAGSAALSGGVLLTQKFDDLTFRGTLAYRHASERVIFADAEFSHMLDFNAGIYIPLDWAHWLLFAEVLGSINAAERNQPGPEPIEAFGGLTYGEFTRISIGASVGLNDEGGSAARRFAFRLAHHFGAEDRQLEANIEAVEEPRHFGTDRRSQTKLPKPNQPRATSGTERSKNKRQATTVDKLTTMVPAHKSKQGKSPTFEAASHKVPEEKVATVGRPTASVVEGPTVQGASKKRPSGRNAPKLLTTESTTKQIPVAKATAEDEAKQATSKPPTKNQENPAPEGRESAKNSKSQSLSKANTEPKLLVPKAVAVPKNGTSTKPLLTAASKMKRRSVSGKKVQQPKQKIVNVSQANKPNIRSLPAVKPVVVFEQPLTVSHRAGQVQTGAKAVKKLKAQLKDAISKQPNMSVVVIETYAAPGERPYSVQTHTPQRDAYELAVARADALQNALEREFPKLSFESAPRIWPPNVVKGNDFWSGAILKPAARQRTNLNQVQNVSAPPGGPLTVTLKLEKPVSSSDVDLLNDGGDVLIIRMKRTLTKRKWVRLSHARVKRSLLHPSYETVNSGILRIRLNGALPEDFADKAKVTVSGSMITVAIPELE